MRNNLSRTACIFFAVLPLLPPAFAEKIVFSADSMSGTVGDKSDETQLKGNAYVLTETMEISAGAIKLSGANFRYIEAEGSVVGKNMESNLEFSCGALRYDRRTKVANLQDDVSLVDVENNVAAKAQMIEYNQVQDVAVMQIDIELKQKDNVCTGAYAVYRKSAQLLELSGNARITQGDDTFRAQEIVLNLDSQEITLDGRVKGSIVDERNGSSGGGASKGESASAADSPPSESGSEMALDDSSDGVPGGMNGASASESGGAKERAE